MRRILRLPDRTDGKYNLLQHTMRLITREFAGCDRKRSVFGAHAGHALPSGGLLGHGFQGSLRVARMQPDATLRLYPLAQVHRALGRRGSRSIYCPKNISSSMCLHRIELLVALIFLCRKLPTLIKRRLQLLRRKLKRLEGET
jgi:hypothetical protein